MSVKWWIQRRLRGVTENVLSQMNLVRENLVLVHVNNTGVDQPTGASPVFTVCHKVIAYKFYSLVQHII